MFGSKKHSKVKTSLDDETQRRKHFYGIDAGVKKAPKDGKQKVGKAEGVQGGKKSSGK